MRNADVVARPALTGLVAGLLLVSTGCAAGPGDGTLGAADCTEQLRAHGVVYSSYGSSEREAAEHGYADRAECEDVGEEAAGSVFADSPPQVRTWTFTGYPAGTVLGVRTGAGGFRVFIADSVPDVERDRLSAELGGDRDREQRRGTGPGPQDAIDPTAGRSGPLPDGGAASCVEAYSVETLGRRAFAFEGRVVGLGPSVSDRGDDGDLGLPGVTFEVGTWFAGGGPETVTVDLQPPGEDWTPGEAGAGEEWDPALTYGVGSRLVVSGEARWGGSPLTAPIAWGCGFTRYHDAATATIWSRAF